VGPPVEKAARRVYQFVRSVLPPGLSLSLLFLRSHGRWPNLRNPKTFSEKIQHRKLHDRNPLLPILTDKIRVKDYVRKKLGDAWVTPTLWSGKKLPPRSERNWKAPFAIKASHGCSWNVFVHEPVADWGPIETTCETWINATYCPHLLEWAYSKIDPRILVEPFNGSLACAPYDYKFHVFSGRVEYIYVVTDRFISPKLRFFDRNWIAQDIVYGFAVEQRELPKPPHFSELLGAAEELGSGFPFVRVDLYDQDRPLFGEMTFYPCSGTRRFVPRSWDLRFGELWVDTSYPEGSRQRFDVNP
jgi:hypothetical protein